MTKGNSFMWPAGKNPYFITPDGSIVELEVVDNIPFLRRGAILCQPVPLLEIGRRNTPHRSWHASPAADVGGGIAALNDEVQIGIIAEVGAPLVPLAIRDEIEALMPEVEAPPPPPVLDAEQAEQVKVRCDLKAYAISREHLLTHKPANPYCDA
eukprot:10923655-Heterocapsa_arctica.AAC.1